MGHGPGPICLEMTPSFLWPFGCSRMVQSCIRLTMNITMSTAPRACMHELPPRACMHGSPPISDSIGCERYLTNIATLGCVRKPLQEDLRLFHAKSMQDPHGSALVQCLFSPCFLSFFFKDHDHVGRLFLQRITICLLCCQD